MQRLLPAADGALRSDSVQRALGSVIRSELAVELGAEASEGCLAVDDDQRTSVPGLYAAGDVAKGLTRSATLRVKPGVLRRGDVGSFLPTRVRRFFLGHRVTIEEAPARVRRELYTMLGPEHLDHLDQITPSIGSSACRLVG